MMNNIDKEYFKEANYSKYIKPLLKKIEVLKRVREQMFDEEYIYERYKDEPHLIKCHNEAYEAIYKAIKMLKEIEKYEEGK